MRLRRTTILALVVATLAVPATALADDSVPTRDGTDRDVVTDVEQDKLRDRTFEAAKQRALEAIDRRLRVLAALSDRIATSRFITEQHAGRLQGDIAPATSHLEALRRKVEDASSWEELSPLIGQIDDDKVLVILAPKTAQVIASDSLVAAARKLETYSGVLETVIGRFEAAGYDVDEAWRLLDEMDDLVAEALRLAKPVAENVIGLTPDDWPNPAQGILAEGRADLHAAADSLKSAHRTAVQIVHFLRNLFDGQTDLNA